MLARFACVPTVVMATLAIAACSRRDESQSVLDASVVVVTSPAPVAPPVATFDQTQGNPDATPTVTAPVQSVIAGGGKPGALEKAIEASRDGRSAEVRRLLENKVRSGHASGDEVRLVIAACKAPYDQRCLDDINAKYPR